MADPGVFDHLAREGDDKLFPHKPTKYDKEIRAVYAKYGYPETPTLIRHHSTALPKKYKTVDAYFEHRNNGHPAGSYSDDVLMRTVMAHMATNEYVARCHAYIKGLDKLHFAAVRLYLSAAPINRVAAVPAPLRAGNEHVKFSNNDKERFVLNADGTVDMKYQDYNNTMANLSYLRFSGFTARQSASREERMKAATMVLAHLLQEVMDGAPVLDREIVVWRMGLFPKMLPGEPVHAIGKQMCSALASNAFISTSLLSGVPARFAQFNWETGRPGYLARIVVPKGVRCLYLGNAVPTSDYENDAEILFAPNTCFTPTDDWHEAPTYLGNAMMDNWGQGLVSPYLTTDVVMRNYVADTNTRPHAATAVEYCDARNLGVQIVPGPGIRYPSDW